MCGITGYCSFNRDFDSSVIERMTETLVHRGPDSNGTSTINIPDALIALGHTRLSILDLSSTGSQPMHRSDTLSIVFNGEIYNFNDIRADLEDQGHTFRSSSDTEVVLAAYQEWGLNCIEKFHGIFAFCLLDKVENKMFLVRDRVGSKPLYYFWKEKLLIFGSELKAFSKHPGFTKYINEGALQEFLKYSYIPAPYSIFQDTWKLEPGHILTVDLSNQSIENKPYWEVVKKYNEPKLDITYNEAVDYTEEVLKKSFQLRMVSDVPVGLFLSGGYDSTAIASILQSNNTDRIKSYTIGFEEPRFNEAEEAKKIAKHLGTVHTEMYIGPGDVEGILTELPRVYDEPFADNSVVPTLLVSKLARQDVKVVLSGDGGDEIFGGYGKFQQSIQLAGRFPNGIQTLLAGIMGKINAEAIPFASRMYNFPTRYNKLMNIWSSHSPFEALKLISQYITSAEIDGLLLNSNMNLATNFDIQSQLNEGNDTLNKLLAIDYSTFLVDNNLVKVDRAGMSLGLECREPFLDQSVIEFVAKLPSEYKIRDGVTKSLLKDIVHRYVPKDLMERPKKPFVAPLALWFKDEINQLLIDHINEDSLRAQGIFNTNAVIDLRNRFLRGDNISFQKVWNLLVFQLWYNEWID